ncbi:MAG: hypothetical protein M1837_002746 [Sclerophora amabilis]|nr:MAG: hypothetical protein M1837_002746 [Sclerophora amabilis]
MASNLQIQADGVRRAVSSTSSCSSSTVTILDELLFPDRIRGGNNTSTKVKGATSVTSHVARKPRNAQKAKTQVKVTVLEVPEKQRAVLCVRERFRLATDVVNTTLKVLNEIIKSTPTAREKSAGKDAPPACATAGRKKTSRSNTSPQQPLQNLVLNRIPSSPARLTGLRRVSSSPSISPPTALFVAECSRLGFSYLRQAQATKIADMQMEPLQIATGMSALVGKLIGLGFNELALKEIRILRRVLLMIHEKRSCEEDPKPTSSAKTGKESLAELLEFNNVDVAIPVIRLIIATQLQILKLVSTMRRGPLVGDVLGNLSLSSPGSPANLILTHIRPLQPAKAAQQLDSLSQLCLSLCPSVSTNDDNLATSPKITTSPDTSLRLQQLAFRIRLLWWEISGHDGDVQRDILEPFSRCINAFSRRSFSDAQSKYECAVKLYKELEIDLNRVERAPGNSSEPKGYEKTSPTLRCFNALASLSELASMFEDGLHWNKRALHYLKQVNAANVVTCVISVRLASLLLRQPPSENLNREILGALGQTCDSLKGSLRGDSTELDDLAKGVSSLRRAAMSYLDRCGGVDQVVPDEYVAILSQVTTLCKSSVFACVRFYIRYIGPAPVDGTDIKEVLRYDQRRHGAEEAALKAIDSAILLSKMSVASNGIPWDLLDSAMQDCLDLARPFWGEVGSKNLTSAQRERLNLVHIKVSHIYWASFLQQNQYTGSLTDPQRLSCLKRSVDAVLPLTSDQRRKALLAIKFERLGNYYYSNERWDQAKQALQASIQEHIENGVLRRAAEALRVGFVEGLWKNVDEMAMFERVLTMLVKTSSKIECGPNCWSRFFDDDDLAEEERLILLEQQLKVLLGLLESLPNLNSLRLSIEGTCRELLRQYETGQYPIRRMRFHISLLRLTSEQQALLSTDMMQEIEEVEMLNPSQDFGKDESLRDYFDHLKATIGVILTLREPHVSADNLRQALTTWSSLVMTSRSLALLRERIDDIDALLSQLSSIAEFFDMKGMYTLRVPTLSLITTIRELQEQPDQNRMIEDLSALGLQYTRLGYSGKAGTILSQARRILDHHNAATSVHLQWQLAHAEHLLGIDNLDGCVKCLEHCDALVTKDSSILKSSRLPSRISGRVELKKIVANAFYVYSKVALQRGMLEEATTHAKTCVRLNHRAWATIESRGRKQAWAEMARETGIDTEGLADDLSTLSTSVAKTEHGVSTSHQSLNGPSYWSLVPSLHRGLRHLAGLYSHQGMIQEAIYYMEQAQKIVEAVKANGLLAHYLGLAGNYWNRSGNIGSGKELLQKALEAEKHEAHSKSTVELHCFLAFCSHIEGNLEDELAHYAVAERLIEEITSATFLNKMESFGPSASNLDESMRALSIAEVLPGKCSETARRTRTVTTKTKRATTQQSGTSPDALWATSSQVYELLGLYGDVLRLKASAMMLKNRNELASSFLSEAGKCPYTQQGNILQRIGIAKQLVQYSLEQMSSDAVFCVLQDSTISIPFTTSSLKVGHNIGFARSPGKTLLLSPCRASAEKPPAKRGSRSKTPVAEHFVDILNRARDKISESLEIGLRVSSTATLHTLALSLSKITMLLSASTLTRSNSIMHPMMAIYSLELARTVALRRQKLTIGVERHESSRDDVSMWPGFASDPFILESNDIFPLDLASFRSRYIDILPSRWTVISISLSERQDELYISKLQSDRSPFLLRLPLGRHCSRDADEEVFNFEQGREELSEIIRLANLNTHDARDMTRKGAKSRWWAERKELDIRLENLLVNMENVWLRGFRGIFTHSEGHLELLARFQRSFHNILNKHLPSRQKPKRSKSSHITLDPRILELFVGLGNPTERDEIEEMLIDLLYFVIDILQFHGERNAYDEVDFDSLVVETQDALRCYHEAAEEEAARSPSQHIVLILDKAVHAIPWESLPCLKGQAVSRMSSLGCLRDRILARQRKMQLENGEDFYVERGNGAYVLNPSGDLKATQASFEGRLTSLKTWDSIIQRDPTESEIKGALESRDLFLYFGHGSGAQYIRAKTIKRLDKCAVTLLLGCSSGALTEAGEFEPYGTPINYMHAGCPALVATLWDVTDKDIDRFSHRMLEDWGLFSGSISKEPSTPPRVGKKRDNKALRQERRSPAPPSPTLGSRSVSLVEAVATARDSCILKYLNGAAPVVYGIPVFLA